MFQHSRLGRSLRQLLMRCRRRRAPLRTPRPRNDPLMRGKARVEPRQAMIVSKPDNPGRAGTIPENRHDDRPAVDGAGVAADASAARGEDAATRLRTMENGRAGRPTKPRHRGACRPSPARSHVELNLDETWWNNALAIALSKIAQHPLVGALRLVRVMMEDCRQIACLPAGSRTVSARAGEAVQPANLIHCTAKTSTPHSPEVGSDVEPSHLRNAGSPCCVCTRSGDRPALRDNGLEARS
jgi:hypothetical protein